MFSIYQIGGTQECRGRPLRHTANAKEMHVILKKNKSIMYGKTLRALSEYRYEGCV
jgi:hypothetical protein